MGLEIGVDGKAVPFAIEFWTVEREADAGKVLTDDELEGVERLVVDEIDVLFIARPEGDDAEDIAKIDLVVREEVDIEGKGEFVGEAERVIGAEVEGGAFFLYDFMAAEDQSIGLGMCGEIENEQSSNAV
jgi:hypothetical protein